MDDTFVAFECHSHIQTFMNHLNNASVLNFTCEYSHNNLLNFIGISVDTSMGNAHFSVYRKSTLTFCNGRSHVSRQAKYSAVHSLVSRALELSSSHYALSNEISNIGNKSIEFGLNPKIVERIVRKHVDKWGGGDSSVSFDAGGRDGNDLNSQKFIKLPYINNVRTNRLQSVFRDSNIKPIFISTRNLYSALRVRESGIASQLGLPNVVYEFRCRSCGKSYIGQTGRQLYFRIREHRAINSKLFCAHSNTCNEPIIQDDFRVLDCATNRYNLLVKEAYHIKALKPGLNSKVEGYTYNMILQ